MNISTLNPSALQVLPPSTVINRKRMRIGNTRYNIFNVSCNYKTLLLMERLYRNYLYFSFVSMCIINV